MNGHPTQCTDCHKPADRLREHYTGFKDPGVCGTCHGPIGTPHFKIDASDCTSCHVTKRLDHTTGAKISFDKCITCHSHAHTAAGFGGTKPKPQSRSTKPICNDCHK